MLRLSQLMLVGNLLLFVLNSPQRVVSQEENLNFCDIPCVINIYKRFCGDAKCTTGASDYPQRFALCSDVCTSAVIGDVMSRCLTQSIPERDDWDEVQTSTLEEIGDYCTGYDIPFNFDVKPQKMGDVDKSFLKSMFKPPELDEEKTTKEEKKEGSSKRIKSRKIKPGKGETEEEEGETEIQDEGDPKEESKGASEKTTSKTAASKSARSGDKKQERNRKEEEEEETITTKTKKRTSTSSKSKEEEDDHISSSKTKKKTSTSSKSKEEEEDDDDTSSSKTKKKTSRSSKSKEEEGEKDSEQNLAIMSTDQDIDEAVGSEASQSMEEVESIEESLEQGMDDSKASKSG